MRRVVVILALLVLALPMVAWANTVTITNQDGLAIISDMGASGLGTIGSSTLTSHSSVLTTFDGLATGGLGRVIYATGALMSGTIVGDGTFSSTGSSFLVAAYGAWLSGLGLPAKTVDLFSGTFTGPITWTFLGKVGNQSDYVLTGSITGVLWNGQTVNGTTTQDIYFIGNKAYQGLGHISFGTTTTPEPGTLGLLGTGLVGLAGVFRRKFMRS